MSGTAALPSATTGDLLGGRYRLLELVGEGGMARVYRAEDTLLGRVVAVKVLRSSTDGESATDRALVETRMLATLSYHSLVTLFDAHITTTGHSYLVMEYIEGRTLRERVEEGPLSSEETAGLAVDLAEALHVVHAADVVHRDVKPSNVLLFPSPIPGREFRAKIADFGIAYLLDATRVTAAGSVVGTAAYLAPEQVRGAAPRPPVDIYGLGLVLLETLTGRRAFAPAGGVESVVARLTLAPEIPTSLPIGWQRLLARMTARDPDDRPSALEVASAASALLASPTATAAAPAIFGAASSASDDTQPLAAVPPVPPMPSAVASPSPAAPTEILVPQTRRAERATRRRRRALTMAGAATAAAAAIVTGAHFGVVAALPGEGDRDPVPSLTPLGELAPVQEADAPAADVPAETVIDPAPSLVEESAEAPVAPVASVVEIEQPAAPEPGANGNGVRGEPGQNGNGNGVGRGNGHDAGSGESLGNGGAKAEKPGRDKTR